MHKRHLVIYLCALLHSTYSSASISQQEEPLPIGNFSLPKSQRPGAFYSFGSKILEPGQVQLRDTPNIFKDTPSRYFSAPFNIQFGTSKHTSFLFSLPITADQVTTNSTGTRHLSGLGNIGLQMEYEFYDRHSLVDTENAGLIASVTLPSGDTAISSPYQTFFIGGTYTHTWTKWILFGATGYLMNEAPARFRSGDILYFESGIGRDIYSKSGQFNFTGFLEINGQYDQNAPSWAFSTKPISQRGSVLNNGYLIFFSPSLWYSNRDWIVQLGVSTPIAQQWAHTTETVHYYTSLTLLYTFSSR